MIYAATITIPANTGETDAVRTTLNVTAGLVWRIEVNFPPGCCGLAHCQIFDGSYQVYPATPGESFNGDGVVIGFDDLYYKQAAPFEFAIRTWNTDETWEHTLQIRIAMASAEAFMSRYMPSITWEKFQDAMNRAIIEQEIIKRKQIAELLDEMKG